MYTTKREEREREGGAGGREDERTGGERERWEGGERRKGGEEGEGETRRGGVQISNKLATDF